MQTGCHTAYLGLGSNLGDRAAYLLRAIGQLNQRGITIKRQSSLYQTAPVDYLDQKDFLNLVIAVAPNSGDPFHLLQSCLEIETALGRKRTTDKGARVIDLDLLLFDELIIDGQSDELKLILPHPRLPLRRFVLAPLAELAPELQHPVLGATMRQLLAALPNDATDAAMDQTAVHVYQG